MKQALTIVLLVALTAGCTHRSFNNQSTHDSKSDPTQGVQPLTIIQPVQGQSFTIGETVDIAYRISPTFLSSLTKGEVLEIYLADSTGHLYGKIGAIDAHDNIFKWDSTTVTMNGGLDPYEQRPTAGTYSCVLVAWAQASQGGTSYDGDALPLKSLDGVTTFKNNQLFADNDGGGIGSIPLASVLAATESGSFGLR